MWFSESPQGRGLGVHRRHILSIIKLAALWGLTGCGFAPRQAPSLAFRSIALNGFAPHSEIAAQLRVMFSGTPATRLIDDVTAAEVILDALLDSPERARGTITPAGQVRSINLLYRFKFRLRNAAGRELVPVTELASTRSMSYNESQALGKEKEEADIFRSMQHDLADQIMRRLAAIRSH